MTDAETAETGETGTGEQQKQEQAFTQADVDKIVRDRLAQQAKNKFGDYDELKTKAEGAKTLEDRLVDVESRYQAAERRALVNEIANKHGISAEDRDLFLTGTDEDSLEAQAVRLASRDVDRKKQGNVAPKEGETKSTGTDKDLATKDFLAQLHDHADQ